MVVGLLNTVQELPGRVAFAFLARSAKGARVTIGEHASAIVKSEIDAERGEL